MKKSLYKKDLVFGIIALFVGVVLAPAITAIVPLSDITSPRISENKELSNDLVEITVQVGNKDHKVMLTPDQANELENLIDRTKTQLDTATTIEETSCIFNDTVVSLFDLSMLPDGLSIEEVQQLVNGMELDSRIIKKLGGLFKINQGTLDVEQNFLCLISGQTYNSNILRRHIVVALIFSLIPLFAILGELLGEPALFLLPIYYSLYKPIAFGSRISFGHYGKGSFGWRKTPAHGWLHSIGLNGIKKWNGSFYGKIPIPYGLLISLALQSFFYTGITGFTGINIQTDQQNNEDFYLGAALWVNIGYDPPTGV